MEDQALHIVGEVDEGDFGFGALNSNGSDKQTHMRFLLREDMFGEHVHLRFDAVGLAHVAWHWLALRLLAVDAANPAS